MRDYWASPHSDEFFDHFDHRFETLFLSHHKSIVNEIAKAVEGFGSAESRVVEIGVGNGRVLEYMASKLEVVAEFHGIDINREQIERSFRKIQDLASGTSQRCTG